MNRTVRRPIPLLSRSPGDEGDLDEGAQGAGEDPAGRVVELMPSRRRPDPEPTLSILPGQIHIGDCFTDAETGDEPHEWEVVSRPVTFKKGHEVRARVQRPGDPGTAREKYWAAHEKITVRRRTAALSRPTAEIEDDVASRTTSPTSTPCAASSGGCAPRSCASRRTSACSRSASLPSGASWRRRGRSSRGAWQPRSNAMAALASQRRDPQRAHCVSRRCRRARRARDCWRR